MSEDNESCELVVNLRSQSHKTDADGKVSDTIIEINVKGHVSDEEKMTKTVKSTIKTLLE